MSHGGSINALSVQGGEGVGRDKAAGGWEMLDKLEKSLEAVGFSLRI